MNTSTCSQLIITDDPPTPNQCVGFADLKRGNGVVIETTSVGLHATSVRLGLPTLRWEGERQRGREANRALLVAKMGNLACVTSRDVGNCFEGENHRVELVLPLTTCNTLEVHMLQTANKATKRQLYKTQFFN